MSADLKVVELLPKKDSATELPSVLRALADRIEKGEYGAVRQLAWTLLTSTGNLSIGIAGGHGEHEYAHAHMLFGKAQHYLEEMEDDD